MFVSLLCYHDCIIAMVHNVPVYIYIVYCLLPTFWLQCFLASVLSCFLAFLLACWLGGCRPAGVELARRWLTAGQVGWLGGLLAYRPIGNIDSWLVGWPPGLAPWPKDNRQ